MQIRSTGVDEISEHVYFSKALLSDIGFREMSIFVICSVSLPLKFLQFPNFLCLVLVYKVPLFLLLSRVSSPAGGDDVMFFLLPVIEWCGLQGTFKRSSSPTPCEEQ